jgi:hypothetical protein
MPEFTVTEISRYKVIANSLEDARQVYEGITQSTSSLSEDEFNKLVDAVEYLDGSVTYKEN